MFRLFLPIFLLIFCITDLSALPPSYDCPPSVDEMNAREFLDPISSDPFWEGTEDFCWYTAAALNIWRPGVANRSIAYENSDATTTSPIYGQSVKIPMRWSFGFSLIAGHRFYHEDWRLQLGYTYFNELCTTRYSSGYGGRLIPLQSFNLLGSIVDTAEGSIRIFWNNLNFLAAKNFHFYENIFMQGLLGIDTTWLSLKEDVKYYGGAFLAGRKATVEDKESYWGIGPKMGFNSKWLFMGSFYFRGDLLAALQYGIFNLRYEETLTATADGRVYLRDKETGLVPALDLGLGIGFADYICDKTRFLSLDLSYESRFMWRQNEWILVDPYSSPRYTLSNTDLSFQGFTFKVSFLF